MLTGPCIQVRNRRVHQIAATFTQQQPEIQLMGCISTQHFGIDKIQTASLKFQFTGTTEKRQSQFRVGSHNLTLPIMGAQLIAGPGGIVTTVSRFQLQQSATGIGQVTGTGLLPERQAIAGVLAIGFTQ